MFFHAKKRLRPVGGFTLVELVIVVCILSIIAAIAVQHLTGISDKAKMTAAESDLLAIRDALAGSETSPGYLDDMGAVPGFSPANIRVANLMMATNLYGLSGVNVAGEFRAEDCASPNEFRTWSTAGNRGWRGPYLRDSSGWFPKKTDRRENDDRTYAERGFFPQLVNAYNAIPGDYVRGEKGCSVYGFPGEPSVDDPWGNPYVIQVPPPQAFTNAPTVTAAERFRFARIVSAGPDGILATPCFPERMNLSSDEMRVVRLAGMSVDGSCAARGDDLVLFVQRADIYEE